MRKSPVIAFQMRRRAWKAIFPQSSQGRFWEDADQAKVEKSIDGLGERAGTRTQDPMIKSHVLYRLSYALPGAHLGHRGRLSKPKPPPSTLQAAPAGGRLTSRGPLRFASRIRAGKTCVRAPFALEERCHADRQSRRRLLTTRSPPGGRTSTPIRNCCSTCTAPRAWWPTSSRASAATRW